ncbi:MAG: dockerin type I domain-containing protein [Phycisphaerae bacterium]|nr:dockerin type I domain-containing protein [Phycisphaerae bacterium]
MINDLYLGYSGYYVGATGAYELRGGSLAVGGVVVLGDNHLERNSNHGVLDISRGSLVTNGAIILARGSACSAELGVSTGAYVQTGGLTINQGEGRSTKVTVEVASDGSSLIHTRGTSTLAGVLDVQSVGDFRPREGDRFTVITSSDPSGVYFSGNFSTFTSNITRGLPPGAGAFNGSPNGCNYDVVFLGYTAGDANGDHTVDGGDLALIGGAWMKEGQTWSTCDFNGDGQVDAGDLALFGGNWGWSLPEPAPPDGAALPEPASAGLLLGGGLALIGAWRRDWRTVR